MLDKNEEDFENNLISAINQFKEEFEHNKDCIKESESALIFIGSTGSGKSTLINWLNGANYEYINTDWGGDLRLKKEEGYSKISSGTKSITLYPYYTYNKEHRHLLIDFPGFQDTRGWEEQLIIKLMFYDIVTTIKTKLVVVIQHPKVKLQSRGVFLQDLVKTTFKDDTRNFTSICLFLNQFAEKRHLNRVISSVKEDLIDLERDTKVNFEKQIYRALQQNIIVLEDIQDQEQLNTIFNKNKLDEIWTKIKDTPPRQIEPKELEHSDKISNYLYNKSQAILSKVAQDLKTNLFDKIQDMNQIQASYLFNEFDQFQIQINSELIEARKYLITIEFVKKILKKVDSKINSLDYGEEGFLKILTFFSYYKNLINGFSNLFQNFSIWFKFICFQGNLILQKIQFEQIQEISQRQIEEEKSKNISLQQSIEELQQHLRISEMKFIVDQKQFQDKYKNAINNLQQAITNAQAKIDNLEKQIKDKIIILRIRLS